MLTANQTNKVLSDISRIKQKILIEFYVDNNELYNDLKILHDDIHSKFDKNVTTVYEKIKKPLNPNGLGFYNDRLIISEDSYKDSDIVKVREVYDHFIDEDIHNPEFDKLSFEKQHEVLDLYYQAEVVHCKKMNMMSKNIEDTDYITSECLKSVQGYFDKIDTILKKKKNIEINIEKKEFTVKEKIKYYSDRINNFNITEYQRKYAERRLNELKKYA